MDYVAGCAERKTSSKLVQRLQHSANPAIDPRRCGRDRSRLHLVSSIDQYLSDAQHTINPDNISKLDTREPSMQLFYDASVMCYEQILQSTAHVLKAGKAHAEETGLALGDIVDYRRTRR